MPEETRLEKAGRDLAVAARLHSDNERTMAGIDFMGERSSKWMVEKVSLMFARSYKAKEIAIEELLAAAQEIEEK